MCITIITTRKGTQINVNHNWLFVENSVLVLNLDWSQQQSQSKHVTVIIYMPVINSQFRLRTNGIFDTNLEV